MAGDSPHAPLQVDGVSKRFRQGESTVDALSGLSLSVSRGEFVAIMGASGSGKSTLLHLVAGLTKANEGHVRIEGQRLDDLSDRKLTEFRRRHVGLVFQAFNLIPSLTAEDNVRLPLLSDARSRGSEKEIAGLLDRLGIAGRRRHKPDALSGGEQQRVAIARALVTDPSIILADEPTGSLDSVTGQSICELLRDLCREQKRTIVIVTHEPAVAIWAQRVVVLKDGRKVVELDTAEFAEADELAARYHATVGTKIAISTAARTPAGVAS